MTKPARVDDHIKELLKNPSFKESYGLEMQKLGIAKCIIDYRIKNKLNQKQLAKKIGVTQQHISKIESGEFSSIATLENVLLAIGYTVKIEAVPLGQGVKHKMRHLFHAGRLGFA